MTRTIIQKVVFRNTTSKVLFELYTDSAKHSEVTGAQAKITTVEGAKFSAYDGYITGKNLQVYKNKLIVQAWRAMDWKDADLNSTFIINLEQKGKNVLLHALHLNVPDEHEKSLDRGWHEHYWDLWKEFLRRNPIA